MAEFNRKSEEFDKRPRQFNVEELRRLIKGLKDEPTRVSSGIPRPIATPTARPGLNQPAEEFIARQGVAPPGLGLDTFPSQTPKGTAPKPRATDELFPDRLGQAKAPFVESLRAFDAFQEAGQGFIPAEIQAAVRPAFENTFIGRNPFTSDDARERFQRDLETNRQSNEQSRAILKDLVTGKINPREAELGLAESLGERPFSAQIAGSFIDPLAAAGAVKAGVKGARIGAKALGSATPDIADAARTALRSQRGGVAGNIPTTRTGNPKRVRVEDLPPGSPEPEHGTIITYPTQRFGQSGTIIRKSLVVAEDGQLVRIPFKGPTPGIGNAERIPEFRIIAEGKEALQSRLGLEVRKGAIDEVDAEIAAEFLDMLPDDLLADLRSSFRNTLPNTVGGGEGIQIGGFYNQADSMITIMKHVLNSSRNSDRIIIHEISHHLEQFVPSKDARSVVKQWEQAMKSEGNKVVEQVEAIRARDLSKQPLTIEEENLIRGSYRFTGGFKEWFAEVISDKALRDIFAEIPAYRNAIQKAVDWVRETGIAVYNFLLRRGDRNAAEKVYQNIIGGNYSANNRRIFDVDEADDLFSAVSDSPLNTTATRADAPTSLTSDLPTSDDALPQSISGDTPDSTFSLADDPQLPPTDRPGPLEFPNEIAELRRSQSSIVSESARKVSFESYITSTVPDPLPAGGSPPSGGGIPPIGSMPPVPGPAEIPPLKGRAEAAAMPGELPSTVALELHESAITNEGRRAAAESDLGGKMLLDAGVGRMNRGRWAPRPDDIPLMDELFDALHHPSEVLSGTRKIPSHLEPAYNRLRQLTNWEEAARLDFDPALATIDDYFYRGWKPPENAFIREGGGIVQNPAFKKPRKDATYLEMREAGFEPLSFNPFEQWKLSRMQGVRYRQQMELVDFIKEGGDEFIRPTSGGDVPANFRVPEVGTAFEGKPHINNNGDQITVGRWAVRNDIATRLENIYGKKPNISNLNIAGRELDVGAIIDWLTFTPKRIKLVGSFFQHMDFLFRSGSGGTHAFINALRTGHPVEASKHLFGIPGSARDILGSYFSPDWQRNILNRLEDTTPIRADRPGVHTKGISESGLNLSDPTLFGQDPAALSNMMKDAVNEALASKVIKTIPRGFSELERLMRQGLFNGVYPAAIINDIQKNIAPTMIRQYGKTMTDAQLNRAIAHAANVRFSSLPASQSVVQNKWLKHFLTRTLFSLNELEGLMRQATKALPIGLDLSKGVPLRNRLTAGSGMSKFWVEHWLGTFLYLGAVANIIHFASTGKPLPFNRYTPISSDEYGPLPFGYNTEFLSPNIPLTGKGGAEIMFDTVGQMDTIFRILNPVNFIESRATVAISAFKNQIQGEDFYGRPIDTVGPGGIVSRTVQLAQDLFAPIGIGQAGAAIIADKNPELEPFISPGENKLSTTQQVIQGLGANLRAESFPVMLERLHPGFEQLSETRQKAIAKELGEKVFGKQTRFDAENFQQKLWDLFGEPSDAERKAFERKLDRQFGGKAPLGGPKEFKFDNGSGRNGSGGFKFR